MSISENISLWKQKAEIDYFPLFISLWLSLNAWLNYRFDEHTERGRLELLKSQRNPVFDRFSGLILSNYADGGMFKGNLGELHRALVNANIAYEKYPSKIVSLGCCAIDWNNGQPQFESVLKNRSGQNKLKLDIGLWVENDPERLFPAYMEIVYQIRCALFHGNIAPTKQNERMIRHLYLTLSAVMEPV